MFHGEPRAGRAGRIPASPCGLPISREVQPLEIEGNEYYFRSDTATGGVFPIHRELGAQENAARRDIVNV